jgi:3-dehydroquinate dehydratase-1
MGKSKSTCKIRGGAFALGRLPRVVGVLTSAIPEDFPPSGEEGPSDLVEIRLDQMPQQRDWLARGRSIEARGLPVILTLRLDSEGGGWSGADEERLPFFEQALEHLSTVDVELRSRIASQVAVASRRLGKVCILSYHDFERTPPLAALRSVIAEAQENGSIVKISTMIKAKRDIETLQSLLAGSWKVSVCVIGMGPLGTHTRVSFAALGSCLTYGYLDKPSAPGQLRASELVQQLRALLPDYNKDYVARHRLKPRPLSTGRS